MAKTQKRAHRFKADLSKWIDQSREAARQKFIAICLEAHEGVVEKTPVDTGFCRANWRFEIGAQPPQKAVVDRPKDFDGSTGTPPDMAAVMTADLGDTVWVFNPVAYAPRLENGHSAQAPSGMVRVTMAELKSKYGVRRR